MNSRDLWLGPSVEPVREICSSESVIIGRCGNRRLRSANRTIEGFQISASKFEHRGAPNGRASASTIVTSTQAALTHVRSKADGKVFLIGCETFGLQPEDHGFEVLSRSHVLSHQKSLSRACSPDFGPKFCLWKRQEQSRSVKSAGSGET
jgi:hypothetical protein